MFLNFILDIYNWNRRTTFLLLAASVSCDTWYSKLQILYNDIYICIIYLIILHNSLGSTSRSTPIRIHKSLLFSSFDQRLLSYVYSICLVYLLFRASLYVLYLIGLVSIYTPTSSFSGRKLREEQFIWPTPTETYYFLHTRIFLSSEHTPITILL